MTTINSVGNGLSGSTGTGSFVGSTSPTLVTPALGTPSSGTLTNCTGYPVGSLPTGTDSAVFITNNSGTPAWSGILGNGQTIIGSSTTVLKNTLTGTVNALTVTSASNSITISTPAFNRNLTWNVQSSGSVTMAEGNGYLCTDASLVTLTLPGAATQSTIMQVVGSGAGGWKIAQPAGGQIHYGSSSTTSGTGGSLSSTNRYDQVTLIMSASSGTIWTVMSSIGTLTVV